MDIEDVDPGTLLEWMDGNLSIQDDERALQANALERLCMLLLMSNNVDRCFETYSPDVFVPALCRIFLDAKSPTYVLEATARAITYFLDISIECSHRITSVEGALPAISKRLVLCDAFSDRTDIDLAEQCIKILDRMSSVDSNINVATSYLVEILDKHWQKLHNDSILSALKVVYRICTNQDHFIDNIPLPDMRPLFNSSNPIITDKILACLPFLYKRGAKLPDPLPDKLLINPQLLSVMCRCVPSIDAEFVLKAYTPDSSLDVSIADTLLFCIFEKDMLIPVDDYRKVDDKLAQSCINYIMQTEEPFPPSIAFDSRLLNWTDKHGHSLLCWAAALGSNVHVKQILQAGDNPTKAIHIAACSGKLDNFKSLIEAGANFECLDDNGRNVMALAEERMKGSIAQFLRFAPVFWKPRKNIKSLSSLDLLPFFKPLLSIDFSQISALRLLLRFCHFWNAESVSSLLSCDPKIPAKIADILLQNLLSSKLNGEKTLITLEICKTLIEKHSSHFQSLFIRLGIVERITKLLEQADDNEMLDCKDIIFPPNQPDRQFIVATITPTHGIRSRIAMRILRMKPFSWGEWFIVVTSDHGYVWNRFVVLEFNRSSSFGTYHCFKDNMLYSVDSRKNSIQYGCTTLIDSLDQYVLFMDRFAFARNAAMLAPYETSASNESSEPVTPSTPAIPDYMSPVHTDSLSSAQEINSEESPIFPNNDDVDSAQPPPFTSTKLLGPWSMLYNANDLSQPATITHDAKTEQVISLTATDGTYFSFNVNGKDFKIGGETALRLCSESHTQQCASSATSNTQHNSSTDNNRNPAQVKSACFQKQSFDLATWLSDYFLKLNKSAIIDPVRLLNENYLIDLKKNAHILLDMLKNRKFTHFELISSNLSSCLLNSSVEHIFDAYRNHPGIIVLIETFISQLDELIDDVSDGDDWPIAANNRNYTSVSSSSNGTSETRSSRQAIRLLGNLVRMRIVSANSEDGQMSVENREWMDDRKRLICNSRSIATINPFICIEQLSDQLSSKYLCSWYQDSRNNLHFIKNIQKLSTIEFKLSEPKSSAQSGGIINWVATNAGCCKWIDPLKANLMKVYSNKHRYSNRHRSQKLYSQSGIYSVRVCTQSSENDHSSSSSSQHSNSNRLFFQLDTGLYIRPNSYKITCSNADGKLKRPLKWTLLVSNDAKNWSKADIVMIVQIENGIHKNLLLCGPHLVLSSLSVLGDSNHILRDRL
ncbi:hypothetical protein GJ496_003265 [Pomphorhynchus laevis]|nr:hypothetical protein GJ496_003265 [Pomphorhynchus laevis]